MLWKKTIWGYTPTGQKLGFRPARKLPRSIYVKSPNIKNKGQLNVGQPRGFGAVKIPSLWLVGVYTVLLCGQLQASPEGFHLVSGEAAPPAMEADGSLVVKSGRNAIIQWDSFSVGKNEKFRFQQASSKSSVLNRVVGKSASAILGSLRSNGKIYLINPNGVLIGPNGRIESAGFLGATSDIFNGDFFKDSTLLFKDFGPGTIVNLGTIDCPIGDITLLARSVDNQGMLCAPNGVVSMAAGAEILLQTSGATQVYIQTSLSEEGSVEAPLQQSGTIAALAVALKSGVSPYEKAIKSSGRIDAMGSREEKGRIYLVAEQGIVDVSGILNASHPSGKGGEIHVLGQQVDIQETARIDASGATDGGHVLIGGSFRGRDRTLVHSEQTVVRKGAEISVASYESGNGGRAVVWSDGKTYFDGQINACAGETGGDGGFVEVSGKDHLMYLGSVSTLAPRGRTGELLLDPKNITIVTGGGACPSLSAFLTTPGATVTFDPDSMITQLNMSNVTLQSNSSITVMNGNTIASTSTNILTFNAGNSILFDSTNSPALNLGSADFAATVNDAGADPTNRTPVTGCFFIVEDGCALTTTTGNIIVGGNVFPTLHVFDVSNGAEIYVNGGTIHSDSGNINLSGMGRSTPTSPNPGILLGPEALSGVGTLNPTHDSVISVGSSGSIGLFGQGGLPNGMQVPASYATGIFLDSSLISPYGLGAQNTNMKSSLIQTTGGSVDLTGVGGQSSGDFNCGIDLSGSFSSVTATAGLITMIGTGGSIASGSSHNEGILFQGGAKITTVSGNIVLNGNGGATNSGTDNNGILIDAESSIVSTGAATIFLQGVGGQGTLNNAGISLFSSNNNLPTLSCLASSITLIGTGGQGTDGNVGILVTGPTIGTTNATGLQATVGSLNLTGSGNSLSTGTNATGIEFVGQALAQTSAGPIVMMGTGGGGSNGANGITLSDAGTLVTTATGDITLTGTGGTASASNSGIHIANHAEVTSAGVNLMDFVAASGTSTTDAFLLDSNASIQSLAGSPVTITSTVNDVTLGANSLIQFLSAGDLTIHSARDINMTAGGGANSSSQIILQDGNAFLTAARNVTLLAGAGTGSVAEILSTGATPLIQVIAGVDIVLTAPTAAAPARIAGQHNVTFVSDNDFPTSPGVGPGGFSLNVNAAVASGIADQLRVYTAAPAQNAIFGTLNGATFTAGPPGMDTSQEQFLTYFPGGTYGGHVFKIYYKVSGIAPPPPVPPMPPIPPIVIFPVLQHIGISLSQFHLPLSALASLFRPYTCELKIKNKEDDSIECVPKFNP